MSVQKVTVSIPQDLFDWEEGERQKLGVSRSEFIAKLLRETFRQQEYEARVRRYEEAYRKSPPFRDRITVATLTTQIRGLDAEVFLDERDGLLQPCVVNLDQMNVIFRTALTERVTQLNDVKMLAVERAIHHALGMELPCRLG